MLNVYFFTRDTQFVYWRVIRLCVVKNKNTWIKFSKLMIKFDEAKETHTHGRKTALRLLPLQGYVALNKVWFSRSSVLKRIYKLIIFSVTY